MPSCETCGNEYDKCFTIEVDQTRHTFDCFECAIHKLAPTCAQCGCRIVGHGMESETDYFCSAHCAHLAGLPEMKDHA